MIRSFRLHRTPGSVESLHRATGPIKSLHQIPGPVKSLRQIPGPVKSFLVKAVLLFVGWKLVYLVFLSPGRVLDKPLTSAVAKGTAATLAFFNPADDYSAAPGIHP